MISPMAELPEEIVKLIEKFCNDEAHYRSTNYNELQCRVDFINPLFELLDWDMNSRVGNSFAIAIHYKSHKGIVEKR